MGINLADSLVVLGLAVMLRAERPKLLIRAYGMAGFLVNFSFDMPKRNTEDGKPSCGYEENRRICEKKRSGWMQSVLLLCMVHLCQKVREAS